LTPSPFKSVSASDSISAPTETLDGEAKESDALSKVRFSRGSMSAAPTRSQARVNRD
jgi:hypothetical protein